MHLYFVTLENRCGDVLAAGHFLAKDAATAREIGRADLLSYMPDRAKAEVAKGYAMRARRSNANPANALNAPAAA